MEKVTGTVICQKEIEADIFDLQVRAPEIAAQARPGQFAALYCRDRSRMLPRPISLCGFDAEAGTIRLVYRTAGAGTREFSALREGDALELTGPLGNGFPLEEARGRRVLLIGGGIGIPPMLAAARALAGEPAAERPAAVTAVLGYRSSLFLAEEFAAFAEVAAATEDGSAGTQGTVLDALRENSLEGDVIFACGPRPMLRALQTYAREQGIACWLSLEERMACGVGACLACVCETAETDTHSHVHNARICRDGPVFAAEAVVL